MENPPLHIILSDDDENDRIIFREVLSGLKIRTIVHTVNDGVQLMEYLYNELNPLPHLLFLDLNMPRKNGLECLKEIRANERLREIAVAIFSTSASEKDIEDTFRYGANVYIQKPNDFQELRQVVEKAVMATYQYQDPPFNKANFILRM